MTAFSVQTPYPPFADADGAPLENGYIWLGSAGLDPQSNPVTAYFDAALTIAAAQPIRTQGGYPVYQGAPARIYINGTNYSIRVMNKNGLTVYTALNTTEAWNGSVLADNSVTTAKLAPNAVTAAKVERVAANQVLRSTGVSSDPAWGALNLTTDVTGVLPAANGGTGRTFVVGSMTAQPTTSGTEKTFSPIPAGVKRITVMLYSVGTTGNDELIVQIGDSGGIETTSYSSGVSSDPASAGGFAASLIGFILETADSASASSGRTGVLQLSNLDGNTWVSNSTVYETGFQLINSGAGVKILSDVLTEVRITTVGGTDTFDAGSVNVIYE